MNWGFRGFALIFLLFGSFALFATGRDVMVEDVKPDFVKIAIAFAFPLVGGGMTVHGFMTRLAFSDVGVEKISFLGRQSLPYSSIRGRREHMARGGSSGGSTRYLRLEANDDHPALEFGKKLYTFDEAFWRWFNGLPDLDAMDKVSHKDSNFGLV
jgi:hypothetical protein